MLDQDRWFKFSLLEQMGHIGSEISRARIWHDKNDRLTRNQCIERAFDLIDLTLKDGKWQNRRKELCRFRETLADCYGDYKEYQVSLADLDQYCFEFALAARRDQ